MLNATILLQYLFNEPNQLHIVDWLMTSPIHLNLKLNIKEQPTMHLASNQHC